MYIRKLARNILRGFVTFLEVFAGMIGFYLLLTVVLSRIPAGPDNAPKGQHIVYVTSNGVHTDFVVPIQNELRDWGKELQLSGDFARDTTRKWLAIGWGDKNFFLKTKNWSDLTAGTALKAVFGLGTGAIHIVQRGEPDNQSADVIKLQLTDQQYKLLVQYIDASFLRNEDTLSRIRNHPYSEYDFFFDSRQSYSLAYTCNSWTNTGLKLSQQKACLWTAFKGGIFARYGK